MKKANTYYIIASRVQSDMKYPHDRPPALHLDRLLLVPVLYFGCMSSLGTPSMHL